MTRREMLIAYLAVTATTGFVGGRLHGENLPTALAMGITGPVLFPVTFVLWMADGRP